MEIVWTNQALDKLNECIDYIARYSYAAAEKWALETITRTDQLIDQPESGRIVPEYDDSGLRELIFGNYRLIYRIRAHKETIYIQTVWHVRQKPPETFSE